ncbi:hypothetical protein EYF80_030894 [Liparis tanakae]|uniref:Uncharacterized protein n=1 Tax=Liparis tanakae TaxID=230148 RepID=A0A4Z2H237_9TELE|nr:hypothetical protein EYF80_030894 [Liparis tanakae]
MWGFPALKEARKPLPPVESSDTISNIMVLEVAMTAPGRNVPQNRPSFCTKRGVGNPSLATMPESVTSVRTTRRHAVHTRSPILLSLMLGKDGRGEEEGGMEGGRENSEWRRGGRQVSKWGGARREVDAMGEEKDNEGSLGFGPGPASGLFQAAVTTGRKPQATRRRLWVALRFQFTQDTVQPPGQQNTQRPK